MPSEPPKFDPLAQFAEVQAFWSSLGNPLRSMQGVLPTRYEALDPVVQEIAVLATMHNLASTLQDPGAIKAALNAEIAERAKKLAERS